MAAREQWNSKAGFILAAVGSAVGLGNMWRFSYLTAEGGGAAFVMLYIAFTLAVGLPILLAELTLGRGSGKSPIQALAHFAHEAGASPAWKALGFVFVAAGCIILAYYGVIAGWTVRYAGEAVMGFGPDAGSHFGEIAEGGAAFGFHLLFMVVTVAIVWGGVTTGIERVSTIAMPVLFVLVIGIAIYASTLEGSRGGYGYYLNADLANALAVPIFVDAAGQAFFSLSLGMGAMLTYASYLSRDNDLPAESAIIATADFGVAFLAGLMVFPLIFALGLQDQVSGSTIGALFVALPKAFASMGGAGQVVGFLFFVALVVGALTSAISLLEVVVSAAIDGLGWERSRAAWVCGAAITALGGSAAFSLAILDFLDSVANNLFLIGGGLGLAIFTGWVMKDPISEARAGGRQGWLPLWLVLLRFAVPPALLFVLWNSVPTTWEKLVGLF